MSKINLLFSLLFVFSYSNCLSKSFYNGVALTLGVIAFADLIRVSLPEFIKEEDHKKLNRESAFMIARFIGFLYCGHKAIEFVKTATKNEYLMGTIEEVTFKMSDIFKQQASTFLLENKIDFSIFDDAKIAETVNSMFRK